MSIANYLTIVRAQGPSTAFTLEPTTKLVANTVYQLNTDAKRLLDPAVALLVEVDPDGGGAAPYATAPSSTYVVDYLFGIITFLADQGASALVRVSGSYLPVLDLIGVTDAKYSASRTVLDNTAFGAALVAGGTKTKQLGLKDVTGSLVINELLSTDNDPGAGSLRLQDCLDNATPLLLEIATGGKRFRAWMLINSEDRAGGGVDELINNTVNWTGAARVAGAGFGWEP